MCPPDNSDESNAVGTNAQNAVPSAQVSAASDGAPLTDCRLYILPNYVTYAALVDQYQQETEITDLMVARACEEMDGMQQYPFARAS